MPVDVPLRPGPQEAPGGTVWGNHMCAGVPLCGKNSPVTSPKAGLPAPPPPVGSTTRKDGPGRSHCPRVGHQPELRVAGRQVLSWPTGSLACPRGLPGCGQGVRESQLHVSLG